MVKKIAATAVGAALLLSAALPAFAHKKKSWTVNIGIVKDNNAVAVANTGLNRQIGGGDQDMDTGRAKAYADQTILVNTSTCGCPEGNRHGKTLNFGWVEDNNAVALANTGGNVQVGGKKHHHNGGNSSIQGENGGGGGSEQEMDTGRAEATAWQTIVVNSSLSE